MNRQQVQKICSALAVLPGQPLRSIYRVWDVFCFEFGEAIAERELGRGGNSKPVPDDAQAGKYALHIQACWTYCRVSAGSKTLFVSGDVYEPSTALANDAAYDYMTFDCSPAGNNLFDEVIERRFADLSGFVVSRVSANRLGDITIKFTNGHVLKALPRLSNAEECWRFFEAGAKTHLVMTGLGAEEEEADYE